MSPVYFIHIAGSHSKMAVTSIGEIDLGNTNASQRSLMRNKRIKKIAVTSGGQLGTGNSTRASEFPQILVSARWRWSGEIDWAGS